MRKAVLGLFSIAALCLMLVAVRAAQTSQNLTVVVTPTSSLCNQPVPAEAAAAGYTTLAFCLDFSQGNSGWLDYSQNYAAGSSTTPPYIFSYPGSLATNHSTSAVFFTQDQGQQVLDLHTDASWLDYSNKTGTFSGNINFNSTAINNDSASWPAASYWEWTFRTVSSRGSLPGNWDMGPFQLRNRSDNSNVNFEIDHPEMQPNIGVCDLGMGSWDGFGGNPLVNGCTLDPSNYHTYGTVCTSSISGGTISCTLYSDHSNPIFNLNVGAHPYQVTQRSLDIIWSEPKCNQVDGNASCLPSPPWTVDTYVKSFRVFSCSTWATTGCARP
jgi:hypothetical protein